MANYVNKNSAKTYGIRDLTTRERAFISRKRDKAIANTDYALKEIQTLVNIADKCQQSDIIGYKYPLYKQINEPGERLGKRNWFIKESVCKFSMYSLYEIADTNNKVGTLGEFLKFCLTQIQYYQIIESYWTELLISIPNKEELKRLWADKEKLEKYKKDFWIFWVNSHFATLYAGKAKERYFENVAKSALANTEYRLVKTTGTEDKRFYTDFAIIEKATGNVIRGISVKSENYKLGLRSSGKAVMSREIEETEGRDRFRKKYGVISEVVISSPERGNAPELALRITDMIKNASRDTGNFSGVRLSGLTNEEEFPW